MKGRRERREVIYIYNNQKNHINHEKASFTINAPHCYSVVFFKVKLQIRKKKKP